MKKIANNYLDVIKLWNESEKEISIYLNNWLLTYYWILISISWILIWFSGIQTMPQILLILSIMCISISMSLHFEYQTIELKKIKKNVIDLGDIYDEYQNDPEILDKKFRGRMLKKHENSHYENIIVNSLRKQWILQNLWQILFIVSLAIILCQNI